MSEHLNGKNGWFSALYRTRVKVHKDDTVIINLSLIFSLLAVGSAPWVAVAGLIAALEPVRFILSADVLAMLLSVCGVLAVLLFCLCSCRLKRYLLPAGLSLLGTGVILSLVRAGIPYIIPRLTLEYAGYLQSFLQPVRTFLGDTALALLVTGLILIAIHLFRLLLVRFRRHPDAPQKSAGGTAQTSADLPEIPGEGADPSASSKENP